MSDDTSTSPQRAVARKRPHTKAKSGCIRCKAKKIKCDEGKPSCSHCVRYSEQCEYRPPPPPRLSKTTPERKTSPGLANVNSPSLDLTDLGLLHNWTVAAYAGFGDKPGDEKVWQTDVPHMGLQHPYLMHGILSISALHLARLNPSAAASYLVKAAEHQEVGLAVYREYMANDAEITPDTCHGIIAFGALTIAYAFAWPQHEHDALLVPSPYWRGLLNWAIFLRGPRGIREVMEGKQHWLLQGPMAYQLRADEDWAQTQYPVPEMPALCKLEALIDATDPSVAVHREVYRLLVAAFAKSPFGSGVIGYKLSVFRWVEAMPQGYLDLLCRLEPVSMIYLAHLCVLVKQAADTYWYMQGAAERTLNVVESFLPPDMHGWIDWPKNMVFFSRRVADTTPNEGESSSFIG